MIPWLERDTSGERALGADLDDDDDMLGHGFDIDQGVEQTGVHPSPVAILGGVVERLPSVGAGLRRYDWAEHTDIARTRSAQRHPLPHRLEVIRGHQEQSAVIAVPTFSSMFGRLSAATSKPSVAASVKMTFPLSVEDTSPST